MMDDFMTEYPVAVSAVLIVTVLAVVYSLMSWALSPTSPKFKVGDCYVLSLEREIEEWQQDSSNIMKILQVGKGHYKVHYLLSADPDSFDTQGFNLDDYRHKVDCPTSKKKDTITIYKLVPNDGN